MSADGLIASRTLATRAGRHDQPMKVLACSRRRDELGRPEKREKLRSQLDERRLRRASRCRSSGRSRQRNVLPLRFRGAGLSTAATTSDACDGVSGARRLRDGREGVDESSAGAGEPCEGAARPAEVTGGDLGARRGAIAQL